MMQVKCFCEENIFDLETTINEWLCEMEPITLLDCKYNVVSLVCENEIDEDIILDEQTNYSCLIIYRINIL